VNKIVISFLIALVPLTAMADKRAKIHTMLSIVGADFPDGSKEIAAFDENMDEIQVDAAIAFFTSDAGRQFLLASRGAQKQAIKKLDETIERARRKRVMADLKTLDQAIEGPDVPTVDPWGTPYRNVEVGGRHRYVSAGPDGKFAPDSLTFGAKKGDFGDDYIFEDGQFVVAPASGRP
jgi:hypothetical protein